MTTRADEAAHGGEARDPQQGRPTVGSLASEAGRLFDAIHQATAGWSSATEAPGGDQPSTEQGPRACRVCPVCQVVHQLQRTRPEVVNHLADAMSSLAAAFSELAASRAPAPPARRSHGDVQHIDISD